MPTVEEIRATDPVWDAAHRLVNAIAASRNKPGTYHALQHQPSGFDICITIGETPGSMRVTLTTYDMAKRR